MKIDLLLDVAANQELLEEGIAISLLWLSFSIKDTLENGWCIFAARGVSYGIRRVVPPLHVQRPKFNQRTIFFAYLYSSQHPVASSHLIRRNLGAIRWSEIVWVLHRIFMQTPVLCGHFILLLSWKKTFFLLICLLCNRSTISSSVRRSICASQDPVIFNSLEWPSVRSRSPWELWTTEAKT